MEDIMRQWDQSVLVSESHVAESDIVIKRMPDGSASEYGFAVALLSYSSRLKGAIYLHRAASGLVVRSGFWKDGDDYWQFERTELPSNYDVTDLELCAKAVAAAAPNFPGELRASVHRLPKSRRPTR